MPIKLLVIQADAEMYNIDSKTMATHGVAVSRTEPDNLANISADHFEVILLSSQTASDILHRLRQLRAVWPECKLIIQSECSISLVLACLQSGVTAVLSSRHAPAQLAEVIRQVLNGQYYLDNDVAQSLALRHIKKMLQPFAALSSREFDVFCLLAEGYSLQSMAEQLGISTKTVSNCQSQIKTKLGLESRDAIVAFAKKHGLII